MFTGDGPPEMVLIVLDPFGKGGWGCFVWYLVVVLVFLSLYDVIVDNDDVVVDDGGRHL